MVLRLPEIHKLSRMQLILPAILSMASLDDWGAENNKYGSETARDTKVSRMQLIVPAILSMASLADWGAENNKNGSETAKDT